jgi:hypothetical protein
MLALVDSFRALRVIRPNGRTVGKATRRKAMRETLVSWIAYVSSASCYWCRSHANEDNQLTTQAAIQQAEPIVSRLFGWLPFYAPLKALVFLAFLFLRHPVSD